MKQRRTWLGICIGLNGVAMTLPPMSAASASHKKHHSKNASSEQALIASFETLGKNPSCRPTA